MNHWQLTDASAKYTNGPWQVSFHRSEASQGLLVARDCVNTQQPLQLFAPVFPNTDRAITLTQCVSCGSTLEVTRAADTADPVETTLTWKMFADAGEDLGIDLVISVRTELLQTPVDVQMQTRLPADEVLARDGSQWAPAVDSSAGCTLFRLTGEPLSYLEMIHPDDARGTMIGGQGGSTAVTHSLFGSPLEKGVILRARLRGMLLPREHDTVRAAAAYADFAEAAPPLGRTD